MGIIASTRPSHGAPVNPRLTYAQQRTKKEKKSILIDAPPLIKLQHGTLHYRYIEDGRGVDKKRIELPHEGSTSENKHGYFYHSRLNDFSPNASAENEAAWKFKYVCRGARGDHQRKVYYVCGQGVPQIRTASQEQQFAAGHVYYDLKTIQQDEQYPHLTSDIDREEEEEEEENEDTSTKETPSILHIKAVSTESIAEVRRKIALRLLLPAPLLHISFHGQPLSCESLLSELLPEAGWTTLNLTLALKGTTG